MSWFEFFQGVERLSDEQYKELIEICRQETSDPLFEQVRDEVMAYERIKGRLLGDDDE